MYREEVAAAMRLKYGAPKGITHLGKTLSVRGWAKELGVSASTLHSRLAKGWPVGLALSAIRLRGMSGKSRALAFIYFEERYASLEPNGEAATIASQNGHATHSDAYRNRKLV